LRQSLRRSAERLGDRRRLGAHPPAGSPGDGVPRAEDLERGPARQIRFPARGLAIRRAAARRYRLRPGPHGGIDGRHRSDPRRDRLSQDPARTGSAHGRAEPGHREANARIAHPPEEPAAVVKLVAALFLAAAFACQPDVPLKTLPEEAKQTVALIRSNGPFPYQRDGASFGNREGRLPQRGRGYYREFTVKTPGAKDRGARRIVAG